MLRSLTIAGLLIASPALAEVDDEALSPLAKRSITVGVGGHNGKLAGLDENGWGPNLELAIGRPRWQYFAEGGVARVKLGPVGDRTPGFKWRGGVGVRWLARSFELGDRGSIDMQLEAFTGVSRFQFEDLPRFTRPDLGFGVGYQVRGFFGDERRKQAGLRVTMRVYFAPTSDVLEEIKMIACRGTCPTTAGTSNSGLMAGFGGVF
jgi:hypothetical protein